MDHSFEQVVQVK